MKGYKQTEVGIIPEDWDVKPMQSIGTVIRGASPRPKGDKRYYGGNIPRLMVEDITRDKHWVTPSIDYLTEEGAKLSRLCKRGTLAIVCSGTPSAVGLPALLATDACIHDGILALIQLEKDVSPEFLFYQMSSIQQKLYNAATHGGTFVNLTTEGFKAFKMVFPPTKAEQETIAAALSDMDTLITAFDALIDKMQLIKQGVMQELLTGKKRLPGFNGKWERKSLGELFDFSGGFSASRDQLSSNGHCYLHYGDIHKSSKSFIDVQAEFENIPKLNISLKRISTVSLLEDGDVVFVDASEDDEGASKHIVVVNKENTPFISGLHTIVAKSKTKELANSFRRYCFHTTDIKQQFYYYAVGTKVTGISKTNIAKVFISFPSSLAEQDAIAEILSDMDVEIAALETRREKTSLLKQGMMQELLTGKTRLV